MKAMVSGYSPVGKPSSFAVEISDEHGNNHKRIVPLKVKSKYLAELSAIKYVMQSIPHKDVDLTIRTTVAHMPQIFTKTTKGEWVKRKKQNDLVDEVRELSEQFKSFNCVRGDDDEMSKVKKMAKLANSI